MTLKELLEHRIMRTRQKVKFIENKHGDTPTKDFNYWGGWELGYFEGYLTALYTVLDTLERGE